MATPRTAPPCAYDCTSRPVATSHTRATLSAAPVTSRVRSALNPTETTSAGWAIETSSLPSLTCHAFANLPAATANAAKSRLTVRPAIGSGMLANVFTSLPVPRSQSLTVLSAPAVIACGAPGCRATPTAPPGWTGNAAVTATSWTVTALSSPAATSVRLSARKNSARTGPAASGSACNSRPVATSYTRSLFALSAAKATASRDPFGEMPTAWAGPGSETLTTALPSATVQTFTALSAPAVTTFDASDVIDKPTGPSPTGIAFCSLPVLASQTRKCLSSPTERTRAESGVTRTCRTGPVWAAFAVSFAAAVSGPQMRTVPSAPPVTANWPFGAMATE